MNIRLISAATIASLALAGCASTTPGYSTNAPTNNYPAPTNSTTCYDCGTVTRIDAVAGTGQTSGAAGAVLGGVVGAAAGRAITSNSSTGKQNTATVAGAVAGAVAGNAIQKNMQHNNASYTVYVRMDNGQTVALNQTDVTNIGQGSYVRVYDGRAWAR